MNDSWAQSSPFGQRAGRPGAKKSIAVAVLVTLAACQTASTDSTPTTQPGSASKPAATKPVPAAAVTPAYTADIEALCNAISRAHAEGLTSQEAQVTVAMWLGDNIHTADARAFLVRIQPLAGDAKADALDVERGRVGLDVCPLAATWRTPANGSARLSTP
jgi:hypothetical protein